MNKRLLIFSIVFSFILCLIGAKVVSSVTLNKTLPGSTNLNSGLVGWWTFDGADTGSTYTLDKSGNGNTATSTSAAMPAPTKGKIGQASSFNGASSYLNAGNASNLDITTTFTVSAWIKLSTIALSTSDVALIGKYDGTDNGERSWLITYRYGASGTEKGIVLYVIDANNTITYLMDTDWNPVVNRWYHIVAVYNGSTARREIYYDGVLDKADNAGPSSVKSIPSVSANIGRANNNTSWTFFWPGVIDDLRFYNRALSAKEITQLYQQGGGKLNKTPTATVNLNSGLVGWWTFDGADVGTNGSTFYALDKSGNGKTASTSTSSYFPAITTGISGQSLQFDGVDDGLVTSESFSFSSTQNFCAAAWVYSKNTVASEYDYVFHAVGSAGRVFILLDDNTDINKMNFAVYNNSGSVGLVTALNTFPNNKWTHLVGCHNGTQVLLYIDGVLNNSASWTNGIRTASFQVGISNVSTDPSSQRWKGKMDDVRIYNRALSAKEITQLYQQGGGKINKTPTATVNLNSGLVGWWTFDGADTWSTTTTDKSGNGNHGGRKNGVAVGSGKIGQAMNFDGVNDYVNIADSASLRPTAMTVTLWIKNDSYSHQYVNYPIAKTNGTSNSWMFGVLGNYTLICGDTDGKFYASNGGGTTTICSNTALQTGTWYHIAFTNDGTTTTLYLNGVANGSGAQSFTDNTGTALTIGARSDLAWYSQSKIDDVRVYNRALSAKEITQLYQMGK